MNYKATSGNEDSIKFYIVPLGMYVKPRRVTQNREAILREYASDTLEIFKKILPGDVITNATKTVEIVDHGR